MSTSTAQPVADTFNECIAQELILQVNPNATEAEITETWHKCRDNPWDAGILYALLQLARERA
jgi:hypothetical protein